MRPKTGIDETLEGSGEKMVTDDGKATTVVVDQVVFSRSSLDRVWEIVKADKDATKTNDQDN